jgi:hypothetical protein
VSWQKNRAAVRKQGILPSARWAFKIFHRLTVSKRAAGDGCSKVFCEIRVMLDPSFHTETLALFSDISKLLG